MSSGDRALIHAGVVVMAKDTPAVFATCLLLCATALPFLRLMDRPVPAVYGPSADEKWEGADPTTTVQAAGRK
jgi:hypothetical protein